MLSKYSLYHTHPMTTRMGAKIQKIGNYNTRQAIERVKELISPEVLANILEFNVSNKMVVVPSIDLTTNLLIQLPEQLVLIFDTETTDLLPKNIKEINIWKLTNEELLTYPYITQISAIVYDVANCKLIDSFNTYIQLPKHVIISDIVAQLTGITNELCNNGMPIKQALNRFHEMWKKCSGIVAHNMWFDSKIIKIEFKRNNMFCEIFKNYDAMQCTMIQGMRHLGANRFVKLSYLYEQLFGQLPNVRLHNAIVDTIICLRCYLKVYCDKTINDEQFQELLDLI